MQNKLYNPVELINRLSNLSVRMGKRKKDEGSVGKETFDAVESKRAKKTNPKLEKEKPKKNSSNEKTKNTGAKGASETGKKLAGLSEVSKSLKIGNVYTDSSSSSDSESEKNSNRNDIKSVSDSNSDSDSESSDSGDSSPTSREGGPVVKGKIVGTQGELNQKNSVTNLTPVKSYVPPEKSSSSDSYHSDTEEEDKKRRKKQKKMLQMQLTKKAKKGNTNRVTEIKQEEPSDGDEEGGDMGTTNNDEVPDWPESDYTELIRRMEAQIPPKDNQKFNSRAAKLDWSKIAFGYYSPEECMEVWLTVCKRIRRYRILSEILHDAREWVTKPWTNFYRGPKKNRHPDMPPRPLSSYMLYYLEQKDKVAKENPGMEMTQVSKIISEMYKNLSQNERDKYTDLAAKQREKFDERLTKFYKVHPEIAQQQQLRKSQGKEVSVKGPKKASNPFKLFLQEQLKKYGGAESPDVKKAIEEKAKQKWKNLSDEKKLVWIDWALQDHKRYEDEIRVYRMEHPDYVPPNLTKSVLNKDERNIKERLAGKPIKPPNSAYSLYSRLMLQSDPNVKSKPPKERMAEISKMWKKIPDSQKAHYEKQVHAMQDSYKLEFASYLEGLSPEEREEELKKNQPKRKPGKAEEKAKKKSLKSRGSPSKSNSSSKNRERLNLYKGEPEPPPVRVFDVFYQSFLTSGSRSGSENDKLKEALRSWNALSEAKKKSFRKVHKELKQKYIRDFETFLKSLSPEELKEFSVMKELAKKGKSKEEVINGDGAESDDSDDEGSSSESDSGDSDSDDSDSGKSSKSSSSSDDSE
ncbi:hypothetical protein RUM43_012378 [Polyplax serrata]|uniref:HMG box domain-containing protein n=1 Tax=Polyplax serrata TaxID=468196 RepID=A0AAN8P424_POLSC